MIFSQIFSKFFPLLLYGSLRYHCSVLCTRGGAYGLAFGPETIVPGRRVAISCLGATFDRVIVPEALRNLFPSQLQVIVWKTSANEAITIENMDFEQMEAAVACKASSESTNLLGDSQEEFNILRAQYLSAINDAEREGVLQLMKNYFLKLFYKI